MGTLCSILSVYTLAIFARIIFSWFPNVSGTPAQIAEFLFKITEPLLAPIRRAIPYGGPIDFSPILLLIAIQVVEGVVLHC